MSIPLLPASPNVETSQVAYRKRSHDEFVDANAVDALCQPSVDVDSLDRENFPTQRSHTPSASTIDCRPPLSAAIATEMKAFPIAGSSDSLADAGPSTIPAQNSLSSSVTPAAATSTHPPHPQASTKLPILGQKNKRKAMTEEQEKEREEKKRKQEDAAAEKARIAAERETIKAARAAEKARTDAAKEAKRLKKQEEELAAKAKTERQQNLMASFLKKAPVALSKQSNHSTTTVKTNAGGTSMPTQEVEPVKSAYELNFKPFFVKSGVIMATPPFEMDNETKGVKSTILDEYLRGERGEFNPSRPFNAAEAFDFAFPPQRGIIPPRVKKIMDDVFADTSNNPGSNKDSQNDKSFINAQDLLKAVPMKYLHFYEDVRPAFFGTATTPITKPELRKLARRPTGKLLPLKYDYDSEAEWAEDDGEDLDDLEDEEEELDGDEEMDDFVDDSEAVATVARLGFDPDSLPISTGLCFENEDPRQSSIAMRNYQLELIIDAPEHPSMINPFSSEYWPAPSRRPPVSISTAASAQGIVISVHPPPATRDAATSNSATTGLDGKDVVPRDILEDFKRALISDECRDFSKSTVIEMLAKKFTSCTKTQVRTTLDTIAHRVTPAGQKRSVKQWALLPNFDLKQS